MLKSLITGEWRGRGLDQCLLTSNEKPWLTWADVISDVSPKQERARCTEGCWQLWSPPCCQCGTCLSPSSILRVSTVPAARPGLQPGPFCGGHVELQEASDCSKAPRVFPEYIHSMGCRQTTPFMEFLNIFYYLKILWFFSHTIISFRKYLLRSSSPTLNWALPSPPLTAQFGLSPIKDTDLLYP